MTGPLDAYADNECVGPPCTMLEPCKECREHLDALEVEEALARPTYAELLERRELYLADLVTKDGVLSAAEVKGFLNCLWNPGVLVPELDHGIEGSKTTPSGDPK